MQGQDSHFSKGEGFRDVLVFSVLVVIFCTVSAALLYGAERFTASGNSLFETGEARVAAGDQTLEAALEADAFMTYDTAKPLFARGLGSVWIEAQAEPVSVRNGHAKRLEVLYLDYSNFIELRAYTTSGLGFQELPVIQDSLYPHVPIPPGVETVFLKVRYFSPGFSVFRAPHPAFRKRMQYLGFFMLFNLAVIFSMMLANVVLALYFKSKFFLLHGGFLAFSILAQFFAQGLSHLFFPQRGWVYYGFLFMAYAFTFLAMNSFLRANFIKPFTRVGRLGALICVALALFSWIHFSPVIYWVSTTMVWFIIGFATLLVTNAIRLKKRISQYFILCAAFLIVSGILILLFMGDFIRGSQYSKYVISTALTVESMFFTLGILDTFRKTEEMQFELYRMAIEDPLTQLHNRHYFDINIGHFFENSRRFKTPLYMLLLDIDDFKSINDTYGHSAGDEALVRVARVLRAKCPPYDMLIRWGGEEFVVVTAMRSEKMVRRYAEALRAQIAGVSPPRSRGDGAGYEVTASIGVARWRPETPTDVESWFKKADAALYQAKAKGKNQVCFDDACIMSPPQSRADEN